MTVTPTRFVGEDQAETPRRRWVLPVVVGAVAVVAVVVLGVLLGVRKRAGDSTSMTTTAPAVRSFAAYSADDSTGGTDVVFTWHPATAALEPVILACEVTEGTTCSPSVPLQATNTSNGAAKAIELATGTEWTRGSRYCFTLTDNGTDLRQTCMTIPGGSV